MAPGRSLTAPSGNNARGALVKLQFIVIVGMNELLKLIHRS
jgi:hypothetical protein